MARIDRSVDDLAEVFSFFYDMGKQDALSEQTDGYINETKNRLKKERFRDEHDTRFEF